MPDDSRRSTGSAPGRPSSARLAGTIRPRRRRAPPPVAAHSRRGSGAYRVRVGGASDVERIARMRVALLREERGAPREAFGDERPLPRARTLTRRQLGGPDERFFLAIHQGQAVGMLRCRAVSTATLVSPTRYALITTVYVAREHRRRGVLRLLLRAADAWCREAGLTGMRLRCAIGNAGGRRAWEALGFAPAAIMMARPVPTS